MQNQFKEILNKLDLQEVNSGVIDGIDNKAHGNTIYTVSPHDESNICQIQEASEDDYERAMKGAMKAKKEWASWSMVKRGDIIREFGLELRKLKEPLGKLISLEMGKISSEGQGEVQEVIDMCDYACGLSRSIGGKVMPSERKDHVLIERWNPLGIVGVITAFNFPCAVFGWNACIALVTGNCVIWKGSNTTGLITIATAKILQRVLQKYDVPQGVFSAVVGRGSTVGERLVNDKRIELVSFTGSTKIGRGVSEKVSKRFGRTILELGGNNACIVCEDADIDMAIKAIFFGAIGTCGQRCTTLRRLYIHESLYDQLKTKLMKAYESINIGNPLDNDTVCGPMHTENAVKDYENGLKEIQNQGGKILKGGKRIQGKGYYVEPTIVEIDPMADIVKEEIFAPIMYLFKFKDVDQAIQYNNGVPQGLSSCMFTKNMQNVFKWIGPSGSDCGLVNVNVGPSGAEIGGAFGGEKETGGGRESGSDSWKQYMRRSTCTINFGNEMPLSQGVDFGPKL